MLEHCVESSQFDKQQCYYTLVSLWQTSEKARSKIVPINASSCNLHSGYLYKYKFTWRN